MSARQGTGFGRGFRSLGAWRGRIPERRGFRSRGRRLAVVAIAGIVVADAFLAYLVLRDRPEPTRVEPAGMAKPAAVSDTASPDLSAERVQIGIPTLSDRQVARQDREDKERRNDGARSQDRPGAGGGSATVAAGSSSSSSSSSGSSSGGSTSTGGSTGGGSTGDEGSDDGDTGTGTGGSGGGGSGDDGGPGGGGSGDEGGPGGGG
jgi:hypothetical protein